MRIKTAILGAILLIFSGCAHSKKPIYYWDASYEESVYNYLNEEGDINEQIDSLEKYIQKAYQKNEKIPPGLYAHLGLMYHKNGNDEKFFSYLDKEAELFPESKQYIEFLKSNKIKPNIKTKRIKNEN